MSHGDLPAIALIIGVSSEFYWGCRDAVARAGAVAVEASMADATSAALRWRPEVLLLTEDVYSFDPPRFDALADVVGASLAIVADEDEPEDQVERRVVRAIAAARRAHVDQEDRSTMRAPSGFDEHSPAPASAQKIEATPPSARQGERTVSGVREIARRQRAVTRPIRIAGGRG